MASASHLMFSFEGLWDSLEVRVLVLFSLFLQIVLVATGNQRKYIRRKFVGVLLWLCYLSADAVATIALGILSRASGSNEDEYAIMAFWAPFLLMHLGGPDTITAYSLADNELWSRHFLGFIGQVGIAIYIFLRSWINAPINYLWIPIFVAGLVKYGERTWVLFRASRGQFRESMVSPPDPGLNYAKFTRELVSKEHEGFNVSLQEVIEIDDQDTAAAAAAAAAAQREIDDVQEAYPFFWTFKQLFADLILSFQDRETSLSFFKKVSVDKAFRIVEVELGLMYDLFYTKAFLLYSSVGYLGRFLSWLSIFAAFITFVLIDRDAFPLTEVVITYILLTGAVVIEINAFVIFSSSDWKTIWCTGKLTSLPRPPVGDRKWMLLWLERAPLVPLFLCVLLFWTPIFLAYLGITVLLCVLRLSFEGWTRLPQQSSRRWSNALDHCIECEPKSAKINQCLKKCLFWGYLKEYFFWNGKRVPDGLRRLLFDELKSRVTGVDDDKKLGRYRGDKILLQEMDCFDEINKVEFDQSVILWHMATDFCYHTDIVDENIPEESWLYEESSSEDILKLKREISMLMSNYMMHLLVNSPFMLPSGIGQIRLQDTRAEAIEFFDGKTISRSDACKMLLEVDTRLPPSRVNGDRSKTLLFDACRLAKALQSREEGERWEKISQAWLDILTYAAAQCKWNDHAEKLSQGGELLTHVWLLMAHFGMTDQFQILQGYERVKLNLK